MSVNLSLLSAQSRSPIHPWREARGRARAGVQNASTHIHPGTHPPSRLAGVVLFVASKCNDAGSAVGGTRLGRFLVPQHEPRPGAAHRAATHRRTRR
jgi:hypothetical protein